MEMKSSTMSMLASITIIVRIDYLMYNELFCIVASLFLHHYYHLLNSNNTPASAMCL